MADAVVPKARPYNSGVCVRGCMATSFPAFGPNDVWLPQPYMHKKKTSFFTEKRLRGYPFFLIRVGAEGFEPPTLCL